MLERHGAYICYYTNVVVHPRVLIGFQRTEDLERALHRGEFAFLEIPKEFLSLAGKAFCGIKDARVSRPRRCLTFRSAPMRR